MLDTLSQLFVTHETKNSQKVTISSNDDNPNFVTDPNHIIKLINAIAVSPHLCTITFSGSKKPFTASIIALQPDKGYLVLDELRPHKGNELLHKKRILKLSTFLNGVHLAFLLRIIDSTPLHYKATIPKRIYYPQRRTAPRIFIRSTALKFRTTSHLSSTPLSGTVFDLSRNGACINIAAPRKLAIANGDVVKDCFIELPGELTLHFDLSIRFSKINRNNKAQIGGYFVNLPPQNQKKLDSFIAKLERENIRNQRNLIRKLC
ncbi:flagellar regulator YcgR PilZN domain-containing protein [Methylotuvimicrobium sp. KM2]|uniref:flagellar brake protein n=1 Tax=Methylotuvimicrobium sp. KM2 TaxID=3133976 RepID=UPI003101367D